MKQKTFFIILKDFQFSEIVSDPKVAHTYRSLSASTNESAEIN